jgi:hypothetical protein
LVTGLDAAVAIALGAVVELGMDDLKADMLSKAANFLG